MLPVDKRGVIGNGGLKIDSSEFLWQYASAIIRAKMYETAAVAQCWQIRRRGTHHKGIENAAIRRSSVDTPPACGQSYIPPYDVRLIRWYAYYARDTLHCYA